MIKKLLPKSQFARNVITLMTGTALAQALPIAITPILTRMYSPEEFGVFAVYMAICSILTVLVTGRYELAIIVPEHDEDAINIMALSIGLSFIISFLLLIIVLFAGSEIVVLLGNDSIAGWLYFVPLTTLVMGCYQSLNYWSNRRSHYKRMAVSRVLQSSVTSTTQIASGFYGFGALGLIISQFLGQLFSAVFLFLNIFKKEKHLIEKINYQKIIENIKKYINYPKYMIPGQLANVGSSNIPQLLFAAFFDATIAGYYSLAQRVLTAPMSLVAGAIGDVFRRQAAEQYIRSGSCLSLFLVTIKKLIVFSFLPVLPVFFYGPEIFSLIFGKEWLAAGEIASVLAVMIFFQTISSPLSQTVLLPNWQKADLIWQAARLVCSIVSLYIGYALEDYKVSIILYVSSFSFLYIVHSIMQYKAAKGNAC